MSEVSLVNAAVVICEANHELQQSAIREVATEHNIALLELTKAEFDADPERYLNHARHVLVVADTDDVSLHVSQAKRLEFSLGFVPATAKSRIHEWFGIPLKLKDAATLAFSTKPVAIDVACCNEEVALGMVMLGETPFIDQRSKTYQNRDMSLTEYVQYWLALVWSSIRSLWAIKPFAVRVVTGKDVEFKTAITGLVAIENDVNSAAARLINASLSAQDGKISTIFIAPKSVMEYLSFLAAGLFKGRKKASKLPAALSYIKSDYLKVEAERPMTYFVDGRKRVANSIEFTLLPRAVKINVGDISHASANQGAAAKDTMRTDNLPQNEARLAMIQSHLPLVARANEEDFKDLFLLLKDNAQIAPHYVALMVLSVVVASFGLFLSSPAVIIGAMVLAPLMAPIISLAMALLRADRQMLERSLKTIAIGVGLALGTAALLALIIPIQKVTPEMAGRMHPNLFDLGVAIASGIAGGYAHARESVMKSLPGVAIAVALVPPLSVAGIGIGWWQWDMFSGAMLLFLTNLVGISLAAAFTFLALGYAPIVRAKRGLLVTGVLLTTVAIPLTIAFVDIKQRWQAERDLVRDEFMVNNKPINFVSPQVNRTGDSLVVRSDLVSEQSIDAQDMQQLRQQLSQQWGRPVTLDLSIRLRVQAN